MEGLRLERSVAPVTRAQPPATEPELVSRPRLLALLESGAGRRLTLLTAPAGFGKTTLLADWAATAERPVAWLSLDDTDGDPAAFRTDVDEALGARHRPGAYVLDNVERIAGTSGEESLWRFVVDAPATLRIVLCGRVRPELPAGLSGDVLEIGPADLRMTDVEAAELLHRALGGSFAVREVMRQIERCEGRPAALRLVANGGAAPEHGPMLHRRAASRNRRTDARDAAVEQALLRGDAAEAGRVIARSWRSLVDAGEQEHVLRWIERLPSERVVRDPRLGLIRAWLLLLDGRREESETALDAARVAGTAEGLREAVEREAVLMHAAVPWDDVGSALTLARLARRSERFGARRAVAAWALGSASWWTGDLDGATHALADALDGPLIVRCAAQAVLSRIELERGRGDAALALARTADRTLRERGLTHVRQLGLVATALGAAEAERSPGSAALAQLERGVRLRRAWGHPLETADALIAAAPTAALVVGRRQAAAMLAEARRLVAGSTDPGVLAERLARAERNALPRPDRLQPNPVLSESELAVLRLLSDGLSKREIGAELTLSFNTVHSHTKAIYRKLGVSSRHEAAVRAQQLGVG